MADISVQSAKAADTPAAAQAFLSRLATGALFVATGAFLLFLLQFVGG